MNPKRFSDKIFAVGDIHGSLRKLETLMKRIPFNPEKDLIVFLGDYINRGPETRQVIDFLLDLEKAADHAVFLIGNHEHSLLEYSKKPDPDDLRALRAMGIEATLECYGEKDARALSNLSFMPENHRRFIRSLKPFFRTEKYLFVHAGVVQGLEPENTKIDVLLNTRPHIMDMKNAIKRKQTVIFGHTPFETPFVTETLIGIDTGAVYGNMLTAVELSDMIFYHA